MKIFYIYFFLILFLSTSAFAEVGIIPYRVNNPSEYFHESTGMEYAKLLSIGAIIKKATDITSPVDLEMDLARIGIKIDGTITEDDLGLIGKKLRLNYLLLGTLTKAGGQYISESVLYSVSEKRTVLKISVKDRDIFKLAEKEMKQAFFHYKENAEAAIERSMDAAILLDTSYSINPDWDSVKDGIVEFASVVMDREGIDTKITIFPFGGKSGSERKISSSKSVSGVRQNLDQIKPSGKSDAKSFTDSIKDAVNNFGWRDHSSKIIIAVTNSNLNSAGLAEKYARIAAKKGIKIFSLSLGNLRGDESDIIKRLSYITGARHSYTAYHRKVFEASGEAMEIFIQNGRLFHSDRYSGSWRDGLFEKSDNPQREKPARSLEEIFYNEKKYNLTPYNMSGIYPVLTGKNLINERPLESNISDLLRTVASASISAPGRKKQIETEKLAGKALLSDGKISFWCHITDKKILEYFNKRRDGAYYTVGVVVREDSQNTYGLKFIPRVIDISSNYIPEMMRTSLYDIIKKREHYMNTGLFPPPVWFISVKIEEVEILGKGLDIRDR